MYDSGKVLLFLAVFVALVSFPFWYGAAAGTDGTPPTPAKAASEGCVESKEYMRSWHMDMLDQWRDDAVRLADREYTSAGGKKFNKSLTRTCMQSGCHESEEKFCGECHDYVGVEPYCWDCHVDPEKE